MADCDLRNRRLSWPLAVFLLAALSVGFYNLGGDLMNDDEGTYLYSAWRISVGDLPYADFTLVQTPLSFLPTAALFAVVGPSVPAARALAFLFVLGAALFVYAGTRRFLAVSAGSAAASAGLFLFTRHVFYLGRSFMPDDLMLLLAAGALYSFLNAYENSRPGSYFAAGALAGLAGLAKLNGALILAGFLFYLAAFPDGGERSFAARVKSGAWTLAGFGAAFVLPFAALLLFVPGAAYQTLFFHAGKKALAEGAFFVRPFVRLGQFIGSHNYGLIPVAAAGILFRHGRRDGKTTLLLCVAAAPFVVLFLPGRFFVRYVVVALIPLALLFGAGLDGLVRWKKGRWSALPAALILIALSLGPTFSPSRLTAYDKGTRALTAYVKEHTRPGSFVFGDDPFINFLAERPCPGRLVDVSEAWTKGGLITAEDIRRENEAAQTALIFVEKGHSAHHLVALTDYARFQAYLDEKFVKAADIKREFLDVEVYLRKSP
jgi:hypothetical protein